MTTYTKEQFSEIPRGHYAALYVDPPWHHVSRSAKGQTRRSPSFHYPTMSLREIKALDVGSLAASDCHLFMWTTQPHLKQALGVMDAWGFKYSSVFQFWVKLHPGRGTQMFMTEGDFPIGTGYTSRKNVEMLLLGRRGRPARLHRGIPDLLFAERREHSRKPDIARSRIEAYCVGPRLELFARQEFKGWDVFGNQVDKFPGEHGS